MTLVGNQVKNSFDDDESDLYNYLSSDDFNLKNYSSKKKLSGLSIFNYNHTNVFKN